MALPLTGSSLTLSAVGGPEPLVLCFGLSSWLRIAHILVAFLGCLSILLTPANGVWKLCILLLLFICTAIVHAYSMHGSRSGLLYLYQDGSANLFTADGRKTRAVLKSNGWATRWICVLALYQENNNRHHYCVVPSGDNPPDQYRRLLITLRMSAADETIRKAAW